MGGDDRNIGDPGRRTTPSTLSYVRTLRHGQGQPVNGGLSNGLTTEDLTAAHTLVDVQDESFAALRSHLWEYNLDVEVGHYTANPFPDSEMNVSDSRPTSISSKNTCHP